MPSWNNNIIIGAGRLPSNYSATKLEHGIVRHTNATAFTYTLGSDENNASK